MFFCALSMTASRSLSFCRFSVVLSVLCCGDSPSRCVTESSRSLTERCSCEWVLEKCPISASSRAAVSVCSRANSAISAACGSSPSRQRDARGEQGQQCDGRQVGHEASLRDSPPLERRANGHIRLACGVQPGSLH